jgi:hypothetical protein
MIRSRVIRVGTNLAGGVDTLHYLHMLHVRASEVGCAVSMVWKSPLSMETPTAAEQSAVIQVVCD